MFRNLNYESIFFILISEDNFFVSTGKCSIFYIKEKITLWITKRKTLLRSLATKKSPAFLNLCGTVARGDNAHAKAPWSMEQ